MSWPPREHLHLAVSRRPGHNTYPPDTCSLYHPITSSLPKGFSILNDSKHILPDSQATSFGTILESYIIFLSHFYPTHQKTPFVLPSKYTYCILLVNCGHSVSSTCAICLAFPAAVPLLQLGYFQNNRKREKANKRKFCGCETLTPSYNVFVFKEVMLRNTNTLQK